MESKKEVLLIIWKNEKIKIKRSELKNALADMDPRMVTFEMIE